MPPSSLDTSTAAGKCFLDMLGVFAEFETNLGKDRQLEGIAKAKEAGVYKGRPTSIGAAQVRALKAQGIGLLRSPRRLALAAPRFTEPWRVKPHQGESLSSSFEVHSFMHEMALIFASPSARSRPAGGCIRNLRAPARGEVVCESSVIQRCDNPRSTAGAGAGGLEAVERLTRRPARYSGGV